MDASEVVNTIPPAPLWATRVRNRELLSKQIKHWLAIALLGFAWYLCGLYEMATHSLVAQVAQYIGGEQAKAIIMWFWRAGVCLNAVATLWTAFWIYCDSLCTATEVCQAQHGATLSSVRRITGDLFWESVSWAIVAALSVYLLAWAVTEKYGVVALLKTTAKQAVTRAAKEAFSEVIER